jgi:hypothetical protein
LGGGPFGCTIGLPVFGSIGGFACARMITPSATGTDMSDAAMPDCEIATAGSSMVPASKA